MADLNATLVRGNLRVINDTTLEKLTANGDLITAVKTSTAGGAYMTASAFNSTPPSGVTGQVLFVIQGV